MYNRKLMDETETDEWLKNLPATADKVGFSAAEMLPCQECERLNSPTKLQCFYCGAELEIADEQKGFLRPNLRKLEAWENGYNIIIVPPASSFEPPNAAAIAGILKIETELLQKIFHAGKHLPVARAETAKEAAVAQDRLAGLKIESIVVSDEELNVETAPRRLRGIEFFDDRIILILFSNDEIVELTAEDLTLIVRGAIYERKIEAMEKRRKTGEDDFTVTTETASDEVIIDLYSRADRIGWRVPAAGFDFSGLDTEKGILAVENLAKLIEKLTALAPQAEIVADYSSVRELLSNVWEVEQKTRADGLKRASVGRFNLNKTTIVNNLRQFTKYSRLRRSLL